MELKYYLAVLWRRKWVIVVTVVMTTVATAVGSHMLVPQYKATSTLWVPSSNSHRAVGSGDILLADRLMNTYAKLSTSDPVLTELEQQLGIPKKRIKNSIDTLSIAQTELLEISVLDPNPQLAADVSTNLAKILIKQSQRTAAGRNLRISLFAPAGVPSAPTWLGILATPYWRELNIIMGFIIGLIGGIALAFFFEYLDSTLYTTKQIEIVTRAATLGEIPIARRRQQLGSLNGNTLHGEAFRYLRTSIFFDQDIPLQTLLVTSAIPNEGKSTIVANLALAIAQAERKVIVVDADLRLPTLHKIFDLPIEVGLTNLLKQEVTLAEALQDTNIPGLKVITSGSVSSNPAELLDSLQMVTLLKQLRQQTDLVLIDTPSLRAVTDAAVLAPFVDGVALVVGQAQVQQELVEAARYQLAAVKAKLVGIIVNRAVQDFEYYHHYMAKRN